MNAPAARAHAPAPAAARTWELEDGLVDDELVRIVACRSASGALLYWQPIQRLCNSWDLIDQIVHLSRKTAVDDATLAAFIRFVDRLVDPPTAYPRGARAFDALERIAEIERRRERQSA